MKIVACVNHCNYIKTSVPIAKNKTGNITDSNNYIPIVLANIVSKLFESILLLKYKHYLTTSANLFGFKTRHNNDLSILF